MHFIPIPNTNANLKLNPNHKSRQTGLVWRMHPHYCPVVPPRGPVLAIAGLGYVKPTPLFTFLAIINVIFCSLSGSNSLERQTFYYI